jgi:hypothetical protein
MPDLLNAENPTVSSTEARQQFYTITDYHSKQHLCTEDEMPINKFGICPNPDSFGYIINTATGQRKVLGCKHWNCPVCGPKKRAKMFFALNRYFSKFEYIRMWTLTFSSSRYPDFSVHKKLFYECWRRFIWELRRSKSFSESQNNFRFVKVVELHKKGYIHFHVLIDRFFPVKEIIVIWKRIVTSVTGTVEHSSSLHMEAIPNAKSAANYVIKYITKAYNELSKNIRKWSKSERFSLFEISSGKNDWHYIPWHTRMEDYGREDLSSILTLLVNRALTSQVKSNNTIQKAPILFDSSG